MERKKNVETNFYHYPQNYIGDNKKEVEDKAQKQKEHTFTFDLMKKFPDAIVTNEQKEMFRIEWERTHGLLYSPLD